MNLGQTQHRQDTAARPGSRSAGVRTLIAATVMATGCPGLAQPEPTPPPGRPREVSVEDAARERARLEKLAFNAFDRKDWAAAEAALRDLVPYDADNFVPWYNLACALAMQGKADEAMKMLDQSIARGFADRRTLETDPQLAAIRSLDRYRALLASWDKLLDRRVDANLDRVRQAFVTDSSAASYTTERDAQRRLIYLSAFDPRLFDEARAQVATLSRWWTEHVAPPGPSEPAPPGAGPAPWVIVVLPSRPDYARWGQQRFGDNWERIGGQYSHDNKLLVAQDLGSTLRHEFWHVLHWRDQDARGQRHPIWIMEGLCSLVEDLEVPAGPGAEFRPAPSWRTNQARRLAKSGGLTPWSVLFSLDPKRFTGTRPLAQYAHARSVFLWLHECGKLRDWYAAYTAGFEQDATGKSAFEKVYSKPIKDVERDFKAWLRALPEVQDSIGNGPANLPFDVGPGAGDGVTVDAPPNPLSQRSMTKALGGPDGLKHNDTITAIDGHPIRDLNDLARLLGEYEAGATVTLAYRRKDGHGTVRVTLVPPR